MKPRDPWTKTDRYTGTINKPWLWTDVLAWEGIAIEDADDNTIDDWYYAGPLDNEPTVTAVIEHLDRKVKR